MGVGQAVRQACFYLTRPDMVELPRWNGDVKAVEHWKRCLSDWAAFCQMQYEYINIDLHKGIHMQNLLQTFGIGQGIPAVPSSYVRLQPELFSAPRIEGSAVSDVPEHQFDSPQERTCIEAMLRLCRS